MKLRLTAIAAIAGAVLVAAPAIAGSPGGPDDVQFVEITDDHVDLTFVDTSPAAGTVFEVEYKPLGTPEWSVVRSVAGRPGATIRVDALPHTGVGGCYAVYAIGADTRVGTAQRCTKAVPYAMKLEQTLGWTAATRKSFDDWHAAADRPARYEEFGFDWSTDLCTSGPDQPAGFDFRLPCRRHDFGYRNFRDLDVFATYRARVDSSFLADMRRVCDRERFPLKQVCNGIAATYYQAVVRFGALVVSAEQITRFERRRAEADQGPSTRRDSFCGACTR